MNFLHNLSEIIKGCVNHDSKARRSLYERYYGFALKIVFRYISGYNKAVEVVNAGFLTVFKSVDNFDYAEHSELETNVTAWLRTVMVTAAIDELRKNNFQ